MAWPALLATADRSALDLLGGAVIYTPSDGDPLTVQGIFDAAYHRADGDKFGVSGSSPAVFLRLADLDGNDPDADRGAGITVDGTEYTVREVQKDSQGGVVLLLHEA